MDGNRRDSIDAMLRRLVEAAAALPVSGAIHAFIHESRTYEHRSCDGAAPEWADPSCARRRGDPTH